MTDIEILHQLNTEIGLKESDGTADSRKWFDRHLAPQFAMLRASSTVVGRKEFLDGLAPSPSRRTEVISIQLLGAQRAVVTCLVEVGDGDHTAVFHNVRLFIRAAGSWLLLAWANERQPGAVPPAAG